MWSACPASSALVALLQCARGQVAAGSQMRLWVLSGTLASAPSSSELGGLDSLPKGFLFEGCFLVLQVCALRAGKGVKMFQTVQCSQG